MLHRILQLSNLRLKPTLALTNIYCNCIYINLFHSSIVVAKKRKTSDEKKTPRALQFPKKSSQPVIEIWKNMTVKELATALGKSTEHMFEALSFIEGGGRYCKSDAILETPDMIRELVRKSGMKSRIVAAPDSRTVVNAKNRDVIPQLPAPPEQLRPRPPVVTIMGHVDHGKTSLLDAIRNSRVAASEYGGITQHIGAFTVNLPSGGNLTFLDTPGHAAFSAMRERGANVTDIVVLVIAADDGVMEQTVESIRMASKAKVPIIVAINKIDKANADIDRTKKMLVQQGIQVEDVGGEVQAIAVSALTGQGLTELLEAISVQAEVMALQADASGFVEGVVLESRTDPGRGKLSTAIIKRGTLRKGAFLVSGTAWAKVRAMFDDEGKPVEEAPPSFAVQIIGWRDLPHVGEAIIEVESEKRANEVVKWRQQQLSAQKIESDQVMIKKKEEEHLVEYRAQLETKRKLGRYKLKRTGPREKEIIWDSTEPRVNVIVKGDVTGSVEAILDVLETYDRSDECKLDVVHYGVGGVTENDVELAEAFSAVIYAFNADISPEILQKAKQCGVVIKKQNVIYRMIEDLKSIISSKIIPKQVEEVIGEAKVQQTFLVSEGKKKVPVAGCRCYKGELKRDALYKVTRDSNVIYEGKVQSMRHLKNEVGTVKKDVECGIMFEEHHDLEAGDTIICYKMIPQAQITSWDPGF